MLSRAVTHLRRHAIAYPALFLALSGTSYAALSVPANSVGTRQIRNGAVTLDKISGSAQTALQGAAGIPGPAGPKGDPGVAGPGASGFNELVTSSSVLFQNSDLAVSASCNATQGFGLYLAAESNDGLGVDYEYSVAPFGGDHTATSVIGGFNNSSGGGSTNHFDAGAPGQTGIATAYVHVAQRVYIVTASVADPGGSNCFVRGAVLPTT